MRVLCCVIVGVGEFMGCVSRANRLHLRLGDVALD